MILDVSVRRHEVRDEADDELALRRGGHAVSARGATLGAVEDALKERRVSHVLNSDYRFIPYCGTHLLVGQKVDRGIAEHDGVLLGRVRRLRRRRARDRGRGGGRRAGGRGRPTRLRRGRRGRPPILGQQDSLVDAGEDRLEEDVLLRVAVRSAE